MGRPESTPSAVYFQISVASVSKPIGRRSSVAGSSFIAFRNTSARAGEQPAADQRHRDRDEDAQQSVAEASRGLLDPRVHGLQRRLDGERLREEADDVREHSSAQASGRAASDSSR